MKILSKLLFSFSLLYPLSVSSIELPQQQSNWYRDADAKMKEVMAKAPNVNKAKNVILMVADGNGVTSVFATRIFEGQMMGHCVGDRGDMGLGGFRWLRPLTPQTQQTTQHTQRTTLVRPSLPGSDRLFPSRFRFSYDRRSEPKQGGESGHRRPRPLASRQRD